LCESSFSEGDLDSIWLLVSFGPGVRALIFHFDAGGKFVVPFGAGWSCQKKAHTKLKTTTVKMRCA